MKLKTKRRLGLLGTISLLMTAILSASVSTFAWFQAQANVNVQASSTSTTITVNKPNEYIFYAYKGNGNSSYIPEDNGKTFNDDFTPLTTSALVNAHTNFDNMVPGDIYVFAIKATGSSHVTFTLDQVVSNNATKQGLNKAIAGTSLAANAPGVNGVTYYTRAASGAGAGYLNDGTYAYTKVATIPTTHNAGVYWTLTQLGGERYVYNTDNHKINVGYAMDIYTNTYTPEKDSLPTGYSYFVKSSQGKTASNSEVGTDLFNYSINTEADRIKLDSGSEANPTINTSITFFNGDLTSTNDFFIIWTVVYSDNNGLKYNETDSAGIILKEEPVGGNRYFSQSDTGTSNCYGGLSFSLKKFTLTI